MVYIPGKRAREKGFGSHTRSVQSYDFQDIDVLKAYAESKGLEVKEKKRSLFMRGLDLLSRPLYATAGGVKAVVKGDENILEEVWKGLTGKEKDTYSDVLKEAGVENKWIRGGVGFALDVIADPATYAMGPVFKGIGKLAKIGGKGAFKAASKVSPARMEALEMTGKTLKEAFQNAFAYGAGTSKVYDDAGKLIGGLSDDIAKHYNKVNIRSQEVLAKHVARFGKANKDDVAKAVDHVISLRRAESKARKAGTAFKIAKTGNKSVDDLVNKLIKSGDEIGEITGLSKDKLYKVYYPMIDDTLTGRNVSSGLRVGAEGYLKEFGDNIPDEKLLKKPIEALTRREAEVIRDNLARKTLKNLVKTYGKTADDFVKLSDDAKKGWVAVYEKGRQGISTFPVETAAGKTVRAIGRSKKPLGYLKTKDFNFINNYLFPEFKSVDMLARASGFDTFTNTFKEMVTAWFPGFHVRNALSGTVQNYSEIGRQAFNPANTLDSIATLAGKKRDFIFKNWSGNTDDMSKIFQESFERSSRYMSDMSQGIEILDNGQVILRRMNKVRQAPRNVGNFIESNQKLTAMFGALRKGETIERAIKIAERAGFDYSKITKFESKVMKRLIPFYTFARKNAVLQTQTLAKHPERILNQIKFANGLSEVFGGSKVSDGDIKGIPPWAANALGFKINDGQIISNIDFPIQEFLERVEKPLSSTLTSLNPLVKYPLEAKLGYDLFRNQDIVDINKIAPATGEAIMNAPQWMQDIFRIKKVETDFGTQYYANPKKLHLLRNLPTSRFQNTLEKIFDKDIDKVDKWLAFISGARIYDIDQDLQSYFTERDLTEDYQAELVGAGEGKSFQQFYVPKSWRK